MIKKPWERRLKDLAHVLTSCTQTYFDPELFRLNLNQFLTTSRTITFIIQKNKKEIEGFDSWYKQNIIDRWRDDQLMTWAKDSRNLIEKEGDLEMFSEAKATLIFSYVEEQDIAISTKHELLGIGVKKLVRLAQKKFPSAVSDSAVIKSERRWVANTLENYELLHALNIIYSRMYECCKSLGDLLENPINADITTPSSFDSLRNEKRHVTYLKLNDYSTGKVLLKSKSYDSDLIPDSVKEKVSLIESDGEVNCIDDLVKQISKLVEINFLTYGHLVQVLFLFDKKYRVIDILSTHFDDQSDKYIFWRTAADRAKMMDAFGLVWASELWLRRQDIKSKGLIRNMPIIGERLQVVGVDARNNHKTINWNILRENENSQPLLEPIEEDKHNEGRSYFMRPVLKAIGGDITMLSS